MAQDYDNIGKKIWADHAEELSRFVIGQDDVEVLTDLGTEHRTVFTCQAIQMTWAFAEGNPFSTSTQNWMAQVEWIAKVSENLPVSANNGEVYQADVTTTKHVADGPVIITDPPYYDNIQYADLSDFFYVWLRSLLRDSYPELFAGMMTPRDEEIVAAPRFENPAQQTNLKMNPDKS